MKLHKISSLFVSALLLGGALSSCGDDNDVKTQLQMGAGTLETVSHDKLTFNWDKVEGAIQYGCELLTDNDEVVDAKVTNARTIQFTGLKASTDYTLKVYAYARPYGNTLTSEPLILTGRTDDIIVLATPQQLTYDININNLTFSWEAVANAQAYAYTLTKDGEDYESGSVKETSVRFKNIETATYEFTVTATTTVDGYANSAPVSIEYSHVYEDPVLWSAKGIYTSEYLNSSWETTLIAYKDGSYTLQPWYNVEGYDFSFSIDESDPDDMFRLPEDTEYDTSGWPYVYTGRSSAPSYFYIDMWDNYCYIDLDNQYLELSLLYDDYTTDTFSWAGSGDDSSDDDLSGSYVMVTTGISYMEDDDATATPINLSQTVNITKVSGNTYEFPALYFGQWGDKMTVTANFKDKTLTVRPKVYYDYYTLAGTSSISSNIVGKINDDGSLSFDNFTAWVDTHTYLEDFKVIFTPVAK